MEDLALALLDAFEEDFLKEAKDAWAKYKGTRELLNLNSSVNNGDIITSNWQRKGKVQGRQASLWVLGFWWEGVYLRAFGILWVFCF